MALEPFPVAADQISARALARIAGGLYVLNIVLGAFAVGAAESLPGLFRLGVAAHVVVGLTNIPLAVIFYELFRVVSRRLALLEVFFVLVATAIEMAFRPRGAERGRDGRRGGLRRQLHLLRVLRPDDRLPRVPLDVHAEGGRRADGAERA